MINLVLLSALIAVAFGGYAHHGGHGHQGWSHYSGHGHHHAGHGHHHGGHSQYNSGHGHYSAGHGHYGWHRRPYYGQGWVNVWQTPHNYKFGVNVNGKGYNKYIWQGGDFRHSHPVKYGAY